jgi:hypothetical protein
MLLQFLEALGVTFEMDWDDQVIIEVPEEISYGQIAQAIEPFGKRLGEEVRFRAKQRRSVFVGGSLNGQEVDGRALRIKSWCSHTMPNGRQGYWIRYRIKRGCWEVYEQGSADGRAFFRGFATSEAKAKRGEVKDAQAKGNV